MNDQSKNSDDYQQLKSENEKLKTKIKELESVFSKLDFIKILAAGFICLVFLFATLYSRNTITIFPLPKTVSTDKQVVERIALAKRDTMERYIRLSGVLEPHSKVTVAAQTSGRVVMRNFNEGDYVQKNQILYQMDTKELAKNVRSARVKYIELLEKYNDLSKWDSSLVVMQARRKFGLSKISLNNEKKKLDETKKLFDKGIIPRVEYEQALTTYKKTQYDFEDAKQALETELEKGNEQAIEVLRLKLSNAKEELDEIEARYEATLIRAPLSGIVMLPETSSGEKGSFKNEGDMVKDGDLVATIGATDSYIIRTNVGELSINYFKRDQNVIIGGPSLGNVRLEGKVEWIATNASTNGGMHYFPIRVSISDVPDNIRQMIRLGMIVQATIHLDEFVDVITIPIEAVSEKAGKNVVLVEDENGEYSERKVVVGYSDRKRIIINEGLVEGDRVVIREIKKS